MNHFIIKEINKIFNCDILAPNKIRKNIDGKTAFANFLRYEKKYKLREIGKLININHSAVIHLLKRHLELFEYDKEYRNLYSLFQGYVPVKRWLCIECEFEIKTIK